MADGLYCRQPNTNSEEKIVKTYKKNIRLPLIYTIYKQRK